MNSVITASELSPVAGEGLSPSAPGVSSGQRPAAVRARVLMVAKELRAHYAVRVHRVELLLTSLALSFVGGAAMFGFHALYRGEAGPRISHGSHWLLDSSLGFLALTPALAVLLPLAHRLVGRAWLRPVVVGAAFALVTAPGPLVHDLLVGGGTTLAHAAEMVFGGTHEHQVHEHQVQASAATATHSALSKVTGQLAVGAPVYILLTSLVALGLRSRPARVTRVRVPLIVRPRPAV